MQALKLKDKTDIKIFILYLMNTIATPLLFDEINDIAVTDGVIGCIELAECFAELLDTGNIRECGGAVPEEKSRYVITEQGRIAASTLESRLLHEIRDRSLKSALRRLQFSREGGGIHTDYAKREDGRFDVLCEARDGAGNTHLRVSVIADSLDRAERIRDCFNRRPEHIYRAIFALLSGEADFLFDL